MEIIDLIVGLYKLVGKVVRNHIVEYKSKAYGLDFKLLILWYDSFSFMLFNFTMLITFFTKCFSNSTSNFLQIDRSVHAESKVSLC